ncbi:hypothetical protein NEUTE1DRAFT_110080 [Neurospora tetrasperma FGSC 2508]|uniref:Uncharacterized protein n=1 Tax=Neurospora tetrasperma (strain FGSC 2508 / ATCC MYA-4615 / P0657) TaxID=510951 RepID=F8MMN2_NEUT8|nr:uncharacterized protein NEUTE1DRAFT_110080 [Neurospora tetrasperma FGSC 2508]EGO57906.1 hypothetical protein NEUTE1DRAFT_110080 [Neurospora tetrasperma FGSC 2508]
MVVRTVDALAVPLLLAVEDGVLVLGQHLGLGGHLSPPAFHRLDGLTLLGKSVLNGGDDVVNGPQSAALPELLELGHAPWDLPVCRDMISISVAYQRRPPERGLVNLKAPNIVVVVDVWGGELQPVRFVRMGPEGIAGIGAGGRSSSKQSRPKKSRAWTPLARSTVQPRGAPIFFVKFPGSVFSISCSHGTAHPAVRALSAADGHTDTGAPAALAPSVTEGTSSSNNHARPPNRLLYLRFPAINWNRRQTTPIPGH